MSIIIRYLSLILVTLLVPIIVLETAVEAAPPGASTAAPELGGQHRRAILDALRDEIKQRHGRDVVFVVHSLNVWSTWAWVHALAQSADGNIHYGDVSGLLGKRGDTWEVLELPCNDANNPNCAGHADYMAGLKQRFPTVPPALFTARDTQAGPAAHDAVIAPTGNLSPPAQDTIDFDRDFRGLSDEPQSLTEFVPTRKKSREQPSLADSPLQPMTGTVGEIQMNQQELISKLAELNDELESQRQATAQAHIARHALVSELSGLRDKVLALTEALEVIRTNQQMPDTTLAELREELSTQRDGAQRAESHITTIQSEMASIHAQVSELHSTQQELLDEATDSQQQLNKTNTTTQTQLQSIKQSLQELQTGGQNLTSELTKMGEELENHGQALAQSKAARETLAAELATKKSLDEITVAQQQFKEEQTVARQQFESIKQSLQELQTGGQNLTSELTKMGEELDSQRQANTQSNAARKALIDGLANIRSQAVIADEVIKTEQADRKKLESEVLSLRQQLAEQTQSFAKSGSEIAAMRTALASINAQVEVLSDVQQNTFGQTAQSQEKLRQELTSIREEVAEIAKSLQSAPTDSQELVSNMVKKIEQELDKQHQLYAQSGTDRRKLMSELSEVRNKLEALDEAEQVARASRNQLSAGLSALRQEVAANTDANLRLSQKSASTDVETALKQSATVDEADRASLASDELPKLQVARARSRGEREPATAPHPPSPRKQSGPGGAWKIKPLPDSSDRQFTHRASGTISRPRSRVTTPDAPSEPNTTDQVASVTNLSNITHLNTLSDFDAIDPFLQAWTEDWERKDLEAYLAHYSSDFQPPEGLNRAAWRDQRRNSLLKPAFIDVKLNNIQKKSTGASSAQLTFNQTYRSNLYSDRVVKTLVLRWEDERWKIVKEESRLSN